MPIISIDELENQSPPASKGRIIPIDEMEGSESPVQRPESVATSGLGYIKEHPVKSLLQPVRETLTGETTEDFNKRTAPDYSKLITNPDKAHPNLTKMQMNEITTREFIRGVDNTVMDMATAPINAVGGAIVKGASMIPGAKEVGKAIAQTPPVRAVGRFLTRERQLPLALQRGERRVAQTINNGISKAIRPSVSGKQDAGQVKAYYKNADEAVKTIVENKEAVRLPDEAGQLVNRLPESLEDFSQAISQTKSHIYTQYDDLLKESGRQGATVDITNLASKELNQIINNKALAIKDPNVIEYAKGIRDRLASVGSLSVKETDELIKAYNGSLQAYYRNPTYDNATRAAIDAMLVNRLRSSLDDVVSSATGHEFQALKNKYGALKSIERDVNRRAIVDSRKNPKGLIDFTDIFSAGDVVRGITTLNPGDFVKGTAQIVVKNAFRKLNDPNNIIKNMFRDVEKFHSPRATPVIPEVVKPSSPKGQAAIGNQTKALPSHIIEPGGSLDRGQMGVAKKWTPNIPTSSQPVRTTPPERTPFVQGQGMKDHYLRESWVNKANAEKGILSAGAIPILDKTRLSLPNHDYTKKEEGYRDRPYKDSKGILTIGYGFNMQEPGISALIPKDVKSGKRALTKKEADDIFNKAYTIAEQDAIKFSGESWDSMNKQQKKALIDMSYQLGGAKLSGFKELKKAIKSEDWERASKEILNSKYAREDAPNRARRNSKLMLSR